MTGGPQPMRKPNKPSSWYYHKSDHHPKGGTHSPDLAEPPGRCSLVLAWQRSRLEGTLCPMTSIHS